MREVSDLVKHCLPQLRTFPLSSHTFTLRVLDIAWPCVDKLKTPKVQKIPHSTLIKTMAQQTRPKHWALFKNTQNTLMATKIMININDNIKINIDITINLNIKNKSNTNIKDNINNNNNSNSINTNINDSININIASSTTTPSTRVLPA